MRPLRVLALAPFPPRLDGRHGGSRSIAELLAGLAARHRVAVLALRGDEEPPVDEELRGRCEVVREVPRPARWSEGLRGDLRVALALAGGVPIWVSRWSVPAFRHEVAAFAAAWSPDVVQAEFHLMAQYFSAVPGRAPCVLRHHDPGSREAPDGAPPGSAAGRLREALDRRAWRRYESRAMRRADVVTTFTARDRSVLAPLAGATPVVVIPLAVPLPERAADPLGRCPETVVFVANFVHPPNREAAERLARSIFPRIRARVPHARLRIVGPNPPPLPGGGSDAVTVTGEVADVRPHLEDAAVVVAPLRLGGGMRVKVAESLAAGKAVVATRLAVEGLEVRDGDQLLLADTDDALADAVASLLLVPEHRAALAGRARAWALAALGWDGSVRAYEQLYGSLVRESGG